MTQRLPDRQAIGRICDQLPACLTRLLHLSNEKESTGFSCARDEFETEEVGRMGREFQTRKAPLLTMAAAI